jgi:Protein of unknown function (DUF2505)
MKFTIVQEFEATVADLCAALVDPGYLAQLGKLPGIGTPTTEAREVDGSIVRYEMRFSFNGNLPGAVTRVIDPKKLTWLEKTTVDTEAATAMFAMVPDHYQTFFRCTGSWTVTAGKKTGGKSIATRTISGDLKVSAPVPFVGGQVERAIVSGLKERLAKEPASYATWASSKERIQYNGSAIPPPTP